MMYGFGDVLQPRADSVDVMEDLVMDYISELVSEHLGCS
jgi:hypothetical protein